MWLEIKDSIFTKCCKHFLGTLKTGQKENPYIFQEFSILELNVGLFEHFQKLITL